MSGWLAAGLLVVLLGVVGFLAWRWRARIARVEAALARTSADLEHLERAFARFAPDNVVERLSAGGADIPAHRRVVTVMFADIRGFTSLSEELDPALMVEVLNEYFRRMNGVIREHHGHVSRIMGDGLMALFGALQPNAWQTPDAVRAGLAMHDELARYNDDLAERGLPPLHIGVGIHRGEAISGVVGSDDMMEFTVIGDPVNVAARVEALTRTHDVGVLITEAVREGLDDRFRLVEQAAAPVKGKSGRVVTWSVEAYAERPVRGAG